MSTPAIVHLACPEGRCGRVFSGETAGDARYALRLHLEQEHVPEPAASEAPAEPARSVASRRPAAGKTAAEFEAEERELALGSTLTVRCADCLWEAKGPAREARLEWAAHRRDEHGEDGIVERVEAELAGKTRRRTTGGKRPFTLRENRLEENVRKARLAGATIDGYRDRAGASPSAPPDEEAWPEAGRRPRGFWTRERAIEALQAFASEHGRPPRQRELRSPLPPWTSLGRLFGGLGAAQLAAGLEITRRGSSHAAVERGEETPASAVAEETLPVSSSAAEPGAPEFVDAPGETLSEIAARVDEALAVVRAQEKILDNARGVLREALQELEAAAAGLWGET